MEKNLEQVLEEVNNRPGVLGCMFVNNQGLCLGSKGASSPDSAGLIAALAEQASKLEPYASSPIISLETENKTCLVQRSGTITAAIYKQN